MTYTDVTPSHRQKAVDHLKAVEIARLELDDIYAEGRANLFKVGRLERDIRLGLRIADVHAHLAVADAIALNGPATRGVLR